MRRGFTLIELLVVMVLLGVFSGIAGIWCWPYSINTWLSWADKDPGIGGGVGFLLGLIPGIGWLSPFAAIFTWIVNMFVT